MKTVLVNKPIHPDALKRLSEEVKVLSPFTASASEILEMLLEDVHGIILCLGLDLTADIIDRCKKLEVIGRHGAGVETVDINAATKRGIPVVFAPYGPTESTAEHAFMLMMAAARKLPLLDRATRTGNFQIRDQIVGRELHGANVGIAGFGRIGQRFAQMCVGALDMNVFAFDPFLTRSQIEKLGAIYMSNLVEMAGKVDVLSLHCPLTSQTHHIVNKKVISALKPTAFLINASRGPIVDETALIEALQQNKIAGAGLDVYDPEPPAENNPLFSLDNVVLTPHLASFTDEGRRRMGLTVVEDVLRIFRGENPEFLANPNML